MKIEFEILGKPVGKGRPRLGKYSTYTPEKTKSYEALVQYIFINEFRDFKPFEGRIKAKITAIFEVPQSYSNKKRLMLLNTKYSYTKKPDVDNITKIILDSLNGLAYRDDAQISKLEVEKTYGEQEKVIVMLEEME